MHVHFITRKGKEVEFYRRGKTKPTVIEKRIEDAIRQSAQAAAKLTHLGMAVILTDDLGAEIRTNTESLPWQLGHGAWVVKVYGKSGGYDCSRIRPATAE